MFQDLLSEVSSNWLDYAFVVGVGVFALLVVTGADFASSVVYARKHPESEMARECARTDAITFWIALAMLVLVPLLWPLYAGIGIGALFAALYSLFKNLLVWAWEGISQ